MTMRRDHGVLSQINQWIDGRDTDAVADRELLEHFIHHDDAAAFAALMRRHGPMVLGVCRRRLRDVHAADDVFQAVFLVLARQARSIRRASVGAWLHGVAWNLALKAQRKAARCISAPVPDVAACSPGPLEQMSLGEAQILLDEELQRLPERYRAPLILCYLQGRTRDEAARQLGWPQRRLKLRLEQGRQQMRDRLLRRGVELTAVLAGVELARAPVAAALVQTTADAIAGPVPAAVADLLREGLAAAMPRRLLAAALVIACTVAGALSFGLLAADEKPILALATEPPAAAQPAPVPPQPVDQFGDPLPAHAVARLGTTRFRTGQGMNSAVLSPDGTQLAVAGNEGVDLIDAATGHARPFFRGAFLAYTAEFTADGKQLLISDSLGLARWDIATGKEVLRYFGDKPLGTATAEGGVTNNMFLLSRLALSPDGKRLAVGLAGTGAGVRIWDVNTGKQLHEWRGAGRADELRFSPDGQALACVESNSEEAGTYGRLYLRHPETGKLIRALPSPVNFSGPIAFSPDGSIVAAGGRSPAPDGTRYRTTVAFWDVATGKARGEVYGAPATYFGSVIRTVAFAPDGKTLVWGGWDRAVHVCDVATLKEVRQLEQGVATIANSLVFTRDGARLYAVGSSAIRVWNPEKGVEDDRWSGHGVDVQRVAWRDDRSVMTWSSDDTCRQWDAATGKELARATLHRSEILGPQTFSRDGSLLFTTDRNQRELLVWSVPGGASHMKVVLGPGEKTHGRPAFSPDGRQLAVSLTEAICLWDVATGKEVRRLPIACEHGGNIAWSRDGRMMALQTSERKFEIIDVAAGARISTMPVTEQPWTLEFSPDGRTLAEPSRENVIRLWEVATGKVRQRRAVDQGDFIHTIAWSPDGRTLALAGKEPEITLWDVTTERDGPTLKGHRGRVFCLAFSPDGKRLLSGGEDTTALIWQTPPRPPVAAVRSSRAELDEWWACLADDDAQKAFTAIHRLVAAAAQATPLLADRLTPAPAPDPQKLARWIAELDDANFQVRVLADQELTRLGDRAEAALRQALAKKPSLEVQQRIEELLARLARPVAEPELLRHLRGVEVLEAIGSEPARAALTNIARGAPGARLTREATAALERLAQRRPQ